MKKNIYLNLLLYFFTLFVACDKKVSVSPCTSALCKMTVEGMKAIVSGKTENSLDVNKYFSVLTHLSMEKGFVLDCVYFTDQLGGKPLVYARPTTQPSFKNYIEFKKAISESEEREHSYESLRHAEDYLAHVQTDDTGEGYFQFIVLKLMGDQFSLRWHGAYNDKTILCTLTDLDTLVGKLPGDIEEAAHELNYQPVVCLEKDKAVVRILTFSNWGGFIEEKYTLSRDFPHQLLNYKHKTLVPYDCGILF